MANIETKIKVEMSDEIRECLRELQFELKQVRKLLELQEKNDGFFVNAESLRPKCIGQIGSEAFVPLSLFGDSLGVKTNK